MQWLALNWVWILFLGGMIAMHAFGMGCHAGHGKHPHMYLMLEQLWSGFKWLTGFGFCVGLIESFLYGAYAGLVYVPVYNFMQRRFAN